jgi:hypothetical protein
MLAIANTDLIFGLIAGAIFAGAVLASPPFRQIAMAAAASGLVFLYIERGVRGVLAIGSVLTFDLQAYPSFAYGVAGGVLVALTGALFLRRRRLS